MKYFEVSFDINCPAYYTGQRVGFQNSKDRESFNNECLELFFSAGWELSEDGRNKSGYCCEVSKGKQSLYIHPQQISGAVLETEIDGIVDLLQRAVSFSFERKNVCDHYDDIPDEQYQKFLESKSEDITKEILSKLKTKRRNLYIAENSLYGICMGIGRTHGIKRISKRECYGNMEAAFVRKIFDQLLKTGEIVSCKIRNGGQGYRTATPKDPRPSVPLIEQ